jgi:hypothetical protein
MTATIRRLAEHLIEHPNDALPEDLISPLRLAAIYWLYSRNASDGLEKVLFEEYDSDDWRQFVQDELDDVRRRQNSAKNKTPKSVTFESLLGDEPEKKTRGRPASPIPNASKFIFYFSEAKRLMEQVGLSPKQALKRTIDKHEAILRDPTHPLHTRSKKLQATAARTIFNHDQFENILTEFRRWLKEWIDPNTVRNCSTGDENGPAG